jgi:mono/diheme cytochrome c family protein
MNSAELPSARRVPSTSQDRLRPDATRFLLMSFAILFLAALLFTASSAAAQTSPRRPTFYKDVLPLLQDHCQSCHRPDAVGPMPLLTYEQTRPWVAAIAKAVQSKIMPPWFADPRFGHFSNDPSLTQEQIATTLAWVEAHAPAGNPHDAPPPRRWYEGWNIAQPDIVLEMPRPVHIPADGDVEYTYEIVATHFGEDKWIQMAEVHPSSPQYVHHAVVYIRPPNSKWLRHAPVGMPFTALTLSDPQDRLDAHGTTSDLLLVYAPGSAPDHWPDGMAKFVPSGSDIVFQIHYTTKGQAGNDQSSIGLVFAKAPPEQRVITLQLNNHALMIPPGADDFRVEAQGTLPNDATLLSLFPHMHLRGKRFEYDIVGPDASIEPLLRVNYHFHWQLSYRLATPRLLKAGTKLRAVAWYDNSRNNPHNPNPDTTVTWGDQTYEEMMVGFFDLAVPAKMDKEQFFIRGQGSRSGDPVRSRSRGAKVDFDCAVEKAAAVQPQSGARMKPTAQAVGASGPRRGRKSISHTDPEAG